MVKFKIIVLGRLDDKKLKRCLESIETQTYRNFEVCIVDDASYPKAVEDAGIQPRNRLSYYKEASLFKQRNDKRFFKVSILKNDERLYGALNHLKAISLLKCEDEDVIIDLDADDYFFSERTLAVLSQYYSGKLTEHEVWMTFGSYIRLSDLKIYPRKKLQDFYTEYKNNYMHVIDVLEKSNVPIPNPYDYSVNFSKTGYSPANFALRTYKYFLWKKMKSKHFMIDGEFIKRGEDYIYSKAMLEMAGYHYAYIPELMYVYDDIEIQENKQIANDMWGYENEEEYTVSKQRLYKYIKNEWKSFSLHFKK